MPSVFCLWDYIRRQSSEFVIDPFVENVVPNVIANRLNCEMCGYSRELVTELTVA